MTLSRVATGLSKAAVYVRHANLLNRALRGCMNNDEVFGTEGFQLRFVPDDDVPMARMDEGEPVIIGVHVCEGCGRVYETIGPYLNCLESHNDQVAITERDDDSSVGG